MPRTVSSDLASRLVGEAVRRTRIDAGLTQAELAARINASASYITNIEAGRVNVTIGQLAHIADALGAGLTVDLPLIGGEPIVIRASGTAEQR
jgi:transcriptional regulator with XRE-family HTH domain